MADDNPMPDLDLNRNRSMWIPLLLIPVAFIIGWSLRNDTTFRGMMGGTPISVPSGTIAQCVIPNP